MNTHAYQVGPLLPSSQAQHSTAACFSRRRWREGCRRAARRRAGEEAAMKNRPQKADRESRSSAYFYVQR